MRVIRTIAELREEIAAHRAADGAGQLAAGQQTGASVGFVPTMGALHDGHLSLVAAAREQHTLVVMSIFVNPTQFNDGSDFDHYPRDEARDLELAQTSGVDLVFAPRPEEIYPAGFATTVSVDARLTSVLEGAMRGSAHFDGVATVVSKLLIAVTPDAAYFGEKDFQQLLVVRRMVTDLGLPVEIVGGATVREADGLARSSRNVRLSDDERCQAAAIPAALERIDAAVARGERDTETLLAAGRETLRDSGLTPEYLTIVDPETLETVASVAAPARCVIAVPVGPVRLIDNRLLTPDSALHSASERTA